MPRPTAGKWTRRFRFDRGLNVKPAGSAGPILFRGAHSHGAAAAERPSRSRLAADLAQREGAARPGSLGTGHSMARPARGMMNGVKGSPKQSTSTDAAFDFGSRAALEQFRKAAKKFTLRANKSRETAIQTLISEGIYTKSGKISRNYR